MWIYASYLYVWNPQNGNSEDLLLLSRKLCKANFVLCKHIVNKKTSCSYSSCFSLFFFPLFNLTFRKHLICAVILKFPSLSKLANIMFWVHFVNMTVMSLHFFKPNYLTRQCKSIHSKDISLNKLSMSLPLAQVENDDRQM